MEEKKKGNVIKIVIGVVVVVLIIGIIVFASNQMKKSEAERKVNEAKQQLNEAVDNLYNLKPNSNNNGISNKPDTEKQDYINNSFVLESASVDKSKSTFDEMSLTSIKIKNKGDKTIRKFTITVYFQDEQGNDIAEDSVNLSETIKPNYSWQLDKNSRYGLDNIPDEASKNRSRIAITDIEFE